MSEPSPVRTFSTASRPPEEAAALWRRYMAEVYYDLEIAPRDRQRVSGTIREARMGAVGLSSVQVDAQRVERRKGAAVADGVEHFILVLLRAGVVDVTQGRRTETFGPGDAVLLNAAEAYECLVPDDSDNVTIMLPCHVLRARLPWIDDACGRAGMVDRELVPIVTRLADDVLALRGTGAASRLEDAGVGLVTAMLDGAHAAASARRSEDLSDLLLADLRGYIRRHLGDPDLSLVEAAGACGIAVRTAQRLFQRQGTTFARELMTARLARAEGMLRADAAGALAIGEIAYACGFVSQAHFAGRFRQAFGRTPRDVRAEPGS